LTVARFGWYRRSLENKIPIHDTRELVDGFVNTLRKALAEDAAS